MGLNLCFQRICFLIMLLAWVAKADENGVFSVKDFGAVGDGNADDGDALLKTFQAACQWTGGGKPKVLVPPGTYMAGLLEFTGPCKSTIGLDFQLDGDITAFTYLTGDHWIAFRYIDGLEVFGNGKLDGQGEKTWAENKCQQGGKCNYPINVRFDFVTNGLVRDVTTFNSKFFHVNVLGCKNLKFHNFKVTASEKSINTDGIHVGRSSDIQISDTIIGSGDDCISVGDDTVNLNISGIFCGPGHGIAIGSLGGNEGEKPVDGVTVRNCTLTGTMFGVRIKTWPASHEGLVKNIVFDDIVMNDVSTPILIDQTYCPYNKCNAQLPSMVKIDTVTYNNIRGTSATKDTIKILCSSGVPCQGLQFSNINLVYNGQDGPATSVCSNAKATVSGQVIPPTCV